MLVARTLLKEIKAGEFSLAAAARIPILISARHSRDVARLRGGDRRRLALWQRGNIGWQFGPFCLLAY